MPFVSKTTINDSTNDGKAKKKKSNNRNFIYAKTFFPLNFLFEYNKSTKKTAFYWMSRMKFIYQIMSHRHQFSNWIPKSIGKYAFYFIIQSTHFVIRTQSLKYEMPILAGNKKYSCWIVGKAKPKLPEIHNSLAYTIFDSLKINIIIRLNFRSFSPSLYIYMFVFMGGKSACHTQKHIHTLEIILIIYLPEATMEKMKIKIRVYHISQ